jgi:HEAT repeat protein
MGTNAVPFLVRKFYAFSTESSLRTNVLTFLSELPKPIRFPPFVPAYIIRSEAAEAIREIKPSDEFFLPLVTNRFHGPDQSERNATIYLLCTVGCGANEVMPFLRDSVRSTNAMEQVMGVVRLGQLGPAARPALPDLVELLDRRESDPRAVLAACGALGGIGAEAIDAIPAIKARLARETQVNSRIIFAKTLCQIDAQQTEALAVILELARTPGNPARRYAIWTLGEIGPNAKAAISVLLEAATKDDWHNAATALVKIGETNRALSAVAERLHHGDKRASLYAAIFIVHYDPTHSVAVPMLIELVRDRAWGHIAIQQLAKLRPVPESAVPALQEIAADKDSRFRREAQSALQAMQADVAGQRELH